MSRPRVALSALAAAVALPVTLALPSGPAAAALPTKWTTYKDSSIDAGSDSGTITIKVGSNTHKIAKIVIVVDCDGEKERFTRRNVTIKDNGRFSVSGGRYVSIEGKFWTEHRATGSITTNQCGFFGGDFSAKG
ncbi:MAG TPA: hypothetical protein VFV89_12605 [Nocardioides sp.]|uniref:hypothetical protein n=1 Tax=Nocardioides sp. TaxID=35761 RepID=UPI002E2EEC85|nr:hypothetical protein [Nocardioides sp.]HEX5088643.1 hypothetical protein [Nocardioides sp.]